MTVEIDFRETNKATDAQYEYINSLFEQLGWDYYKFAFEIDTCLGYDVDDLSKQEASDVIEFLKEQLEAW